MNKIVKQLNLKQVSLTRWKNDNYILELKPSDLGKQILAFNCIILMPHVYPRYKEITNKNRVKPEIIENNDEFLLVKADVETFKKFIKA